MKNSIYLCGMKKISLILALFLFSSVSFSQNDNFDQPISDNTRHAGEIDDRLFNSLKPEEQKVYLKLLESMNLTKDNVCWVESDFLYSTVDERKVGCSVTNVCMSTKTEELHTYEWFVNDGGSLPYPQCIVFLRRKPEGYTVITLQVYH
jgi:hypothetical protein